ncbi:MAG: NFACT family protein, partial [cyanobacterium endosymbiont of Rhopalodia yunnanensis]
IMGKYSNIILTDAKQQIITVGHQVSANQSSVRTVETGQTYEFPPTLTGTLPKLEEPYERWQKRISLLPKALKKQMLDSYCGLSPAVAHSMIQTANLDPEQSTDTLRLSDWNRLFWLWQTWLTILVTADFKPGWTEDAYTVLGWGIVKPTSEIQT